MAKLGNAVEFNENDSVAVPFAFKNLRAAPQPGSQVTLFYRNPPETAWQEEKLIFDSAAGGYVTNIETPENAAFECRFRVQDSTNKEILGPWGAIKKLTASAAPATSPSPSAQLPQLQTEIKKEVGQALQAFQKKDSIPQAVATLRALKHRLHVTYGINSDIDGLFLAAIAEDFRTNAKFPAEVRMLFNDPAKPAATFAEFERRLAEGSKRYQQGVFLKLLADPAARELFNLSATAPYNESNPLGKDKWNRLFVEEARGRSLGGAGIEKDVSALLKETASVTATDPELERERLSRLEQLLPGVSSAAQKKVGKILADVPTSRKAKLMDILVHTGVVGVAALSGAWMFGAGALAIKAGLHGLSGLSTEDLVRAYETDDVKQLGKVALKNNIAREALRKEGGLWGRVKQIGKMMVPFWGVKHSTKSSVPVESTPEPAAGATPAAEKKLEKADARNLISKACDAAVQ